MSGPIKTFVSKVSVATPRISDEIRKALKKGVRVDYQDMFRRYFQCRADCEAKFKTAHAKCKNLSDPAKRDECWHRLLDNHDKCVRQCGRILGA